MLKRFLLYIIVFILISACSKNEFDYGLGEYRVDLVTVSDSAGSNFYLMDNLTKLIPTTPIPISFIKGNRVILNYNILDSIGNQKDRIKVNSASLAISSGIKPLSESLFDDPLTAESIWHSGDWLNFRLSIEYRNTKHGIGLYQNSNSQNDTIYLELRHSINNDPAGYPLRIYASYKISNYAVKGKIVPVKVKVNTVEEGIRYYYFSYVSPALN